MHMHAGIAFLLSPFFLLFFFFFACSLRTPLCIRYSPSVICVAAIRMAMRHLISVTKQLDAEPTRPLQPGQQPPVGKPKPWFEELFGVQKRTMNGPWRQPTHTARGDAFRNFASNSV